MLFEFLFDYNFFLYKYNAKICIRKNKQIIDINPKHKNFFYQ